MPYGHARREWVKLECFLTEFIVSLILNSRCDFFFFFFFGGGESQTFPVAYVAKSKVFYFSKKIENDEFYQIFTPLK